MTKKRKSKKAKNLVGLRRNAYRAHTQNFVDNIYDGYIDKLDEKDKKWLNQFNREYYGTTFSSSKMLHKGGKNTKRQLYREKNKREADVWYGMNKINYSNLTKLLEDKSIATNPEESLINILDLKLHIEGKINKTKIEEAINNSDLTREEIKKLLSDD